MSESHTIVAPSTGASKADLIRDTRSMVTALDCSTRQIADNLATLRDRHGMSQRDIAAEIGKSPAWVNRMLAWRLADFPEDTPFGGTERRERESVQRAEHRQAAKPVAAVKLGNGEVLKSLDGFSEAAKQKITAACGNDVDPAASAEAVKAVHAAADASTSKPTTSTSGGTTQPQKGSPEWLFNEAVYFSDHTLAKMDDATFVRAMAMFNARRSQRCLKVAA
jgi:hypothetical protein